MTTYYTAKQIEKAAESLKNELNAEWGNGDDGRFLIDDVITDILNILKKHDEPVAQVANS